MNQGRRQMLVAAGAAITAAALAVGVAAPFHGEAGVASPVTASGTAHVSLDPSVVIEGGTPQRRQTVTAAVDRYLSQGLALPDLMIRIHDGNRGCDGLQGEFRRVGNIGVIDLCYQSELLALHELGHAWERFNLDAEARRQFQTLTGSTTWRSTDVVWRKRGCELAATSLAHGLLSEPLAAAASRERELALFTALTGTTSPRLTEVGSPTPTTTVAPEQIDRLVAFAEWRRRSSAG